jgi:hypothetical protein
MVFFRIAVCEWLKRGRRSGKRDRESDGVVMWGSVRIGKDMVVGEGEDKS